MAPVIAESRDDRRTQVPDLSSLNTEAQGAQTEYSKAKFCQGEITLHDFLLPDDVSIDVPYDEFDAANQVPIVDLQHLAFLADPTQRVHIARDIAQVVESWGFFKVINHGVPLDLVERVEGKVRSFFELPMETKLQARRGGERVKGMCGYVAGSPMFLASRWWAEALQVNEDQLEEVFHSLLPSETDFQLFCHEYCAYTDALTKLSHHIFDLLAEGLGLPTATFKKYMKGKPDQGTMRFNYYPVCPRPDKVWGLIAHRDPCMLGLLHQDGVGGLQIQRAEQWVGVTPTPGSFIINAGDMLTVMSNGRFPSVTHRVVTNSNKARLSMAYFCNTIDDAVITAAPQLTSSDCPAQFRPFTWAEYACMPFQPNDFTVTQEYRPNRLDHYKIEWENSALCVPGGGQSFLNLGPNVSAH